MNKISATLLSCLLCSISLPTLGAEAYRHSRFEVGIGAVALSTPDFPGSSNSNNQLLPFPYVKYRGNRLQVDDGAEFRLFDTPDLKLAISGNGSLPSSADNPERVGMNKLDPTVELGPSLEYRIKHSYTSSLWLELPLRASVTLTEDLDYVGLTTHPRIAWRLPAHFKYDWKLRFATGPVFSDSDYNGYYYDVGISEVSPTRAAYDAPQGYSSFRTDFTYSRRIGEYWLGGFFRHDLLSGSVIEDSSLVSKSSNLTAGFAMAWVFSEH